MNKALILCGGKGTRLRPLTYTRAKQLLPVGNKPIVEYVLYHLHNINVKDIGIIVSQETQHDVRTYLSDNHIISNNGMKMTTILQKDSLGLAHAVQTASSFLKNDPFIMYLGDNLLKEGLEDGVADFKASNLDALVFLKEVDDPRSFGVAVLDEKGEIIKLVEKPKQPPSNLALVGVYIFSPRIHSAIEQIQFSSRGELEITDAIQKLIEIGGKVKGRILKDWWLDTGKKDDLLSANTIILDEFVKMEIKGKVDKSSNIMGRVFIDEGAEVINSKIRGPVVIGKNVKVTNSFIGPYTSIGNNSEIIDSSIEHSVILQRAIIRKIPRLEDSLIGDETQVLAAEHHHKALRLLIGDSAVVEI